MIQIYLMQLILQRSQSKSISRSPSGSDSGTAKSRSGSRSRSGSAGSAKGSPASRRNGSASGSGSGGGRSEYYHLATVNIIVDIFPSNMCICAICDWSPTHLRNQWLKKLFISIGHFRSVTHRSGKKSSSGGSDSGTGGSGGRQESGSGGKSLLFCHTFDLLAFFGNSYLLSIDDRSDVKFSGVKQRSDASQKSSGSERGKKLFKASLNFHWNITRISCSHNI